MRSIKIIGGAFSILAFLAVASPPALADNLEGKIISLCNDFNPMNDHNNYYIHGGQKHLVFTSDTTYEALGGNAAHVCVDANKLNSYSRGTDEPRNLLPSFSDGTIISQCNNFDPTSNHNAYVVKGGRKSKIPDPRTYGYMGGDAKRTCVSGGVLSLIPTGPDAPKLGCPDGWTTGSDLKTCTCDSSRRTVLCQNVLFPSCGMPDKKVRVNAKDYACIEKFEFDATQGFETAAKVAACVALAPVILGTAGAVGGIALGTGGAVLATGGAALGVAGGAAGAGGAVAAGAVGAGAGVAAGAAGVGVATAGAAAATAAATAGAAAATAASTAAAAAVTAANAAGVAAATACGTAAAAASTAASAAAAAASTASATAATAITAQAAAGATMPGTPAFSFATQAANMAANAAVAAASTAIGAANAAIAAANAAVAAANDAATASTPAGTKAALAAATAGAAVATAGAEAATAAANAGSEAAKAAAGVPTQTTAAALSITATAVAKAKEATLAAKTATDKIASVVAAKSKPSKTKEQPLTRELPTSPRG